MHRAIKIDQTFFFQICPNFSEYFAVTCELKLNNDFNYFVHVGTVFKRDVEGAVALLTQKYILFLNFKLVLTNISFDPHSFIWNTK